MVKRKAGWDAHGLPVELSVERGWVLQRILIKLFQLLITMNIVKKQ